MKKYLFLSSIVFLFGCAQMSSISKAEGGTGTGTPAVPPTQATAQPPANSQMPSFQPPAPLVPTGKYIIEPPLTFTDLKMRQALDLIFAKTNAKYVIDDQMTEGIGGMLSYTLSGKLDLDVILMQLLQPRSIRYSIDTAGVYHIKALLVPLK